MVCSRCLGEVKELESPVVEIFTGKSFTANGSHYSAVNSKVQAARQRAFGEDHTIQEDKRVFEVQRAVYTHFCPKCNAVIPKFMCLAGSEEVRGQYVSV